MPRVTARFADSFGRPCPQATEAVVDSADSVVTEPWCRQIFDDALTVHVLVDANTGAVVHANAAACAFYGCSAANLRGEQLADFAESSFDARPRYASSEHHFAYLEAKHRLASGVLRDVEIYSSPLPEVTGSPRLVHSIVHDVTERNHTRTKLGLAVGFDPLSWLPTHIVFGDLLQQALYLATREGGSLAVLLLI